MDKGKKHFTKDLSKNQKTRSIHSDERARACTSKTGKRKTIGDVFRLALVKRTLIKG
eukprot:GSA120T00013727001.1